MKCCYISYLHIICLEKLLRWFDASLLNEVITIFLSFLRVFGQHSVSGPRTENNVKKYNFLFNTICEKKNNLTTLQFKINLPLGHFFAAKSSIIWSNDSWWVISIFTGPRTSFPPPHAFHHDRAQTCSFVNTSPYLLNDILQYFCARMDWARWKHYMSI